MPIQVNLENEAILLQAVEDGRLRVDDWGRIWRGDRRAEHKHEKGYLRVSLYHEGRTANVLAHRLVYRVRTGQIPPGLTINHKNGQKWDNRPMNLELANMQQQALHVIHVLGKNQHVLKQHGEDHFRAKLSNNQVEEIRRRFATEPGSTRVGLAREFQISRSYVSQLLNGSYRLAQGGPLTVLRRQRRASIAVVAAATTNQAADNTQPA